MMPAVGAAVFKTGPLAWDCVASFWLRNIAFGAWLCCVITSLEKATELQPPGEGPAAMTNATMPHPDDVTARRVKHTPAESHLWVMVLGDLVIYGTYFLMHDF